jgi:hypothetical protein
MTFLKIAAVGAFALMTTAASSAQQKFPLRSGEWESTTPDPMNNHAPPMVMPFCLNDELWTKALNKNPSCTFQNLQRWKLQPRLPYEIHANERKSNHDL